MSSIRLGRYAVSRVPFSRPAEALRSAVHIIGSPGMGKSTLLGNLCEQYAAAGDGVLVLDIKGDLARDIASRTRHPDRVIYVKPGVLKTDHGERIWTLNPFEGHRSQEGLASHIAVNVLESFERMGRAELGVMANIRQNLQHAIRLAMTTAEPTLLDLLLIVVDQPYRINLIWQAKHLNHVTRRFWMDLDNPKISDRDRRGQLNTTRNRLEALLMDRELNLFVGSYHSSLRLREWLNQGKMILVDLGLPLPHGLGVDIGNVIMSQMITETYQREFGDKRRTWRLVVDEFHQFVGENFADIITNARSYNVFPVLAHQDRSQLDQLNSRRLKGAVGHAGVKFMLATSVEDRIAFASLFGRDQADLVLGLDRFKAIVSIMDGLTDSRRTEQVLLDDWWGDEIDGQLERIQQAAHALTTSKREVVQRNNQRYWDRLDLGGGGKSRGDQHDRARKPDRKTKSSPPRTGASQPGPSPVPAPGDDPPSPKRVDGLGPASLLDGPPDF